HPTRSGRRAPAAARSRWNSAPSSIARLTAALSRNSTSAVTPCARSKSGTSSCNSGRIAPPLKILICFAVVMSKPGAALGLPEVRAKGTREGRGPTLASLGARAARGHLRMTLIVAWQKQKGRRLAALRFVFVRSSLRRRQSRRFGGGLGLDRRFFLTFGEDELIALDRDLAELVHHRAGSCRDQPADDDVLFETVERVDLAVDCGLGEHARRLLE